jgi:hypothetical protein
MSSIGGVWVALNTLEDGYTYWTRFILKPGALPETPTSRATATTSKGRGRPPPLKQLSTIV